MLAVYGSMGGGGGLYEAAAIALPTTFRVLWKGAMEVSRECSAVNLMIEACFVHVS